MRVPRAWRWLDELTGLSRALGPIARHPVPPAGRSAWLYVFGSGTLITFLVQVVTGTGVGRGYITFPGDA
jgi:ubiquinol-cytochrome c reductase cytochrome b subunit